jgi:arylsulfatase
MNFWGILRKCRVLVALLGLASVARAADNAARPNVVIINCDDLGYADVGPFGQTRFTTPTIDRLAQQGIRFARFYVAQGVCSASRTALLTGCYPNRLGIKGALGPNSPVGINVAETTLGEVFQGQGYATAVFGKWHLGDAPAFLPTRHGFDEYFGLPYSNDMWPLHPDLAELPPAVRTRRRGFPPLPLVENERVFKAEVTADDQRQLTTWYTERAVDFIRRQKERPFLLYLAHSMPHVPLYVSDKFDGKSGAGLFGDVIQEIDWSVGEVLKALDEANIVERTLVIFTSDNGPWLSYGEHAGSAAPLREGKGTSWEGGVRVPFIARWPGHIPAGSTCHEPAMTIDLLPTLAGLIGAPLPTLKIDGLDIWPLFTGDPEAKNPHDCYRFYYADNELQAIISGAWKLYFPHTYRTLGGRPGGKEGRPVPYEQRQVSAPELYNHGLDISETHDLAADYPEVVARLTAMAEEARSDLGDSLTGRTGAGVREPGRVANTK